MSIKLLISELAVRGRYVTREAFHVMRELIERYGWMHMETHGLASQPHCLRERMRERCGAQPDVVLFWEAYHLVTSALSQLYNANFNVVIYCEDLHWFHAEMRATKMFALTVADVILAAYAPVFERFFPEVAAAKRIVWVPHAASPEFMLPLNESAANEIFLSGMINDYYPLRQRLKALGKKTELHIVEHPHPGYQCHHDHETSGVVGAGYARRINASRAAFTDASKFNYMLAKFFEIPATGSLLVGDAAAEQQLSQLGFRQQAHFIPVSDATLESDLRHILDAKNHAELDEVRRRGQQLIWARHKTSDRAKLIDEVCSAKNVKSA
jgi:Glycosyl transferases group 1